MELPLLLVKMSFPLSEEVAALSNIAFSQMLLFRVKAPQQIRRNIFYFGVGVDRVGNAINFDKTHNLIL